MKNVKTLFTDNKTLMDITTGEGRQLRNNTYEVK